MACDDDNPCTDDSCDTGVCIYSNNDALCDDGDICTQVDRCVAGSCEGSSEMSCPADDNPCTLEFCDPVLGCDSVWDLTCDEDGGGCNCDAGGGAGALQGGTLMAIWALGFLWWRRRSCLRNAT